MRPPVSAGGSCRDSKEANEAELKEKQTQEKGTKRTKEIKKLKIQTTDERREKTWKKKEH